MEIGVLGNLTLDELKRNRSSITRPGGSALFSSFAAAYLGAHVSIVSNVGKDYPQKVLSEIRRNGIDTKGIERSDGYTTRFGISYSRDLRTLSLIHAGEKLGTGRFSPAFDAIHLGPVFGEIGLKSLIQARQRCGFLSIDVQGLLRTSDAEGRVRLVRKDIDPFLTKCNLLKATEQEARLLTTAKTLSSAARQLLRKGAEHAVVTRGRFGSLIVSKDSGTIQMPSIPEEKVIDPTGAGDIFIGSWITTFQWVKDARWAGAVGAAFASLSTRGIGLSKFRFSRNELFRRASWAYHHSRLLRV